MSAADSYFHTIDRREAVRVVLLFAVLVSIAFFNVVFLGQSLIPGNGANPLEHVINAGNYGPHYIPIQEFWLRAVYPYANIHDPGGSWWQGEPAMEQLKRALWRGEIPLWDPWAGGGAPMMANMLTATFYPPSFLVALLGNQPWLKNLYILLLFVACGFFTYVFVRKHNVSLLGSIAAGIAFMFSGALVETAPEFIGQSVSGIPLVLAATAFLAHKPTWRRAVLAAFAYATAVLASFPAVTVFTVMIAGVYFVAVAIWMRGAARRAFLLKTTVAVILSGAFVAFYYIPVFNVIRGADYAQRFYRDAGFITAMPRAFYQLIGPTVMGGGPTYMDPVVARPDGNLFYFGITGLVLSIVTIGRIRPLPWLVPFQLLVFVWLLKIFGVQPVQSIAHLPVFNTMHISSYGGILLAFPLACFCGAAVQFLSERRLHFVSTAIAIAGGGALLWRLWRIPNTEGGRFRAQFWRWVADYRIVVVFFVIAAILLLLSFRLKRAAPALGLLMVALLAIEGITNASFLREPRWNYWEHPPGFVRALMASKTLGRVLPFALLPANANSALSIPSTDSLFVFNSTRYTELHHRYLGSGEWIMLGACTVLPTESVLDAFAVDRIAINQLRPLLIAETQKRGYREIFRDDFAVVFERPAAPRYFVTRDYVVRPRQDAFYAVAGKPRTQLLLEQPASFPPDPAFRARPVTVEHFGLNSYRLRVVSPAPALLSISEADFPGWTAKVNGKAVPIRVANYAFRAIEVPAGESVVEMSYWPPGMTAGIIISLTALLIAIGILIVERRRAVVTAAAALLIARGATRGARRLLPFSPLAGRRCPKGG